MWHRVSQRLFLLMLLNNLSKRCTRDPIAERIEPRSARAIQIFLKEAQPGLTRQIRSNFELPEIPFCIMNTAAGRVPLIL